MFRHSTCCTCACCTDCLEKFSLKILNFIFAGIAGYLFFTGWWCAIDAMSVYGCVFAKHAVFIAPGVGSTIAFFMASVLCKTTAAHLNPIYMPRSAVWCFRLLLFIAFFLSFSMIFVAIVLFSLKWSRQKDTSKPMWPMFFAIPQTCLICSATLLYYFGVRSE